ncbi:unnamed protein product [Adineta steineri]|uniref:Uncharacterized protein n=1 Tax=Adineta steineri TaxID=433720 RepID=A0A819ALD2_9BILA|nr:unnamed protein product [Adineta steineri]CAF3779315.1 unnamed protein product [Adineta steineri]
MTTNIPYGDKRRGKSQLQMIASWCRQAQSSILDDRSAFYVEQFTIYEVLSPEVFGKEVQSLTSLFIGSTKNTFVHSLTVIRQTIQDNILMSGYTTNVFPYAAGNSTTLSLKMGYAFYPQSDTCICVISSNCTEPISDFHFNEISTEFPIFSGLRRGCFIDEATLQSTLECYYNQSCLDASHAFFGLDLSNNFTAMKTTVSSQFNATSVMRDILNEMMVEDWIYTSSHASFYNACQPISCSYSYTAKNDLSVIISDIIGLIGGLTTILMIIIPQLIKLVRHCQRRLVFQRAHFAGLFRMEQLRQYWNKGKEKIRLLNIFYSRHEQVIVNAYDLRTQIISTRVFLGCLFVSLFILAIYTSQVPINTIVTIRSPSLDQYSRIYSQYSQSLSCPCTTISLTYDQFVNVRVARFHQICQSIYITTAWTLLIDDSQWHRAIFFEDFRQLGGRFFQTLASSCALSQELITEELIKFSASRFVTNDVMASNLFYSQFESYIQSFISSTKRSFKRSIQLIRELTEGNVLFTGILSNLRFNMVVNGTENVFLTINYTTFMDNSPNCSCQQTPTCVAPSSVFYDVSYAAKPVIRFTVPGIMRGCYILEAFLQSNLICFYNQSCVNNLRSALNTTDPLNKTIVLNTTALDPLLPSQFHMNSTLNDIINELMVEEWITNASHEMYYTACNPAVCTYSVIGKNKLISIISTMIGLFGSLTTILTLIVPIVVKRVRLYLRRRGNMVGNIEELTIETQTSIRY